MGGVVDDAFGNWLAGFIDGEGCFGIDRRADARYPNTPARFSCRLSLVLRDDDHAALDQIVDRLGIGRVVAKAPQARLGLLCRPQAGWHVRDKAGCTYLVELLDRYPLRARKARDYAVWREAVGYWVNVRPRARDVDWGPMEALKRALEEGRTYHAPTGQNDPAEAPTAAAIAARFPGPGR